ncbi:MAG: hypothetical protein WBA28_08240 [Microbacteriaceae bacterium]
MYNGTWTTLRPSVAHGSTSAAALMSANWQGTSGATSTPRPLSDFIAGLNANDDAFVLYGIGVITDDGATVASITFQGNTYNFSSPTPGQVETATGSADYTALITVLALASGLALALGAISIRRKVEA